MKTLKEVKMTDHELSAYLGNIDRNWTYKNSKPINSIGTTTYFDSKGNVIGKSIIDNINCTHRDFI